MLWVLYGFILLVGVMLLVGKKTNNSAPAYTITENSVNDEIRVNPTTGAFMAPNSIIDISGKVYGQMD